MKIEFRDGNGVRPTPIDVAAADTSKTAGTLRNNASLVHNANLHITNRRKCVVRADAHMRGTQGDEMGGNITCCSQIFPV